MKDQLTAEENALVQRSMVEVLQFDAPKQYGIPPLTFEQANAIWLEAWLMLPKPVNALETLRCATQLLLERYGLRH